MTFSKQQDNIWVEEAQTALKINCSQTIKCKLGFKTCTIALSLKGTLGGDLASQHAAHFHY